MEVLEACFQKVKGERWVLLVLEHGGHTDSAQGPVSWGTSYCVPLPPVDREKKRRHG